MYCEKNTANKQSSQERGFTLIELMIAIGIIGILAGLAIANFSNYEAKARQGEAKIALAAIFSSQRSFKGEYGAYIEDLRAIGYEPEGLKRHYTIGWKSDAVFDAVSGYRGGVGVPFFDYANIPTAWGIDDSGNAQCTITDARNGLNDAVGVATDANVQAYVVKARGVIHQGRPCDEWQMNEQKLLSNNITSL